MLYHKTVMGSLKMAATNNQEMAIIIIIIIVVVVIIISFFFQTTVVVRTQQWKPRNYYSKTIKDLEGGAGVTRV